MKNPQAFPGSYTVEEWSEPGMTLLDYFAGQALVGMVGSSSSAKAAASYAYEVAKEMLKLRDSIIKDSK